MILTVDNAELRQVLACVMRVINPHVSIPILSNVLITKDGDEYYIVANNTETELSLKIAFHLISGTFAPICINPTILSQMSGKLGNEQLTFTTDKSKVKINYLTGSFSLPLFKAEEFPRINNKLADDVTSFEIKSSFILPTLSSAATIVCNVNELRPMLSIVALDVVNDGITIIATDGYKLYRRRHIPGAPFLSKGKPRIMFYKSITNTIVKEAFATSDKITIASDMRMLHITSDDAHFISVNIEGHYPNYDRVIPNEFKSQFTVNCKLLMSALQRVILVACQTSKLVTLTLNEEQLTISSSDSDFCTDGNESLDIKDSTTPNGFHIAFKGTLLIDLLRLMQSDEVVFKLNNSSQAAIIVENDPNSEILTLLMPCSDN